MFGPFRRRNTENGNGTEKTVSFKKSIDILNYTPVEYRQTERWANYSDPDRFEAVHSRKIKALKVDEMCGDMSDAEIASEAELMKSSAGRQLISHLSIIDHHKGMIDGKLTMLNSMLHDLECDLEDIDARLEQLEPLKHRRNSNV